MSNFKSVALRHKNTNQWLKRFHTALKRDTWDEVLPFLRADIARRKNGDGGLIPEKIFKEELHKYYADYGYELYPIQEENHDGALANRNN